VAVPAADEHQIPANELVASLHQSVLAFKSRHHKRVLTTRKAGALEFCGGVQSMKSEIVHSDRL
jgi:hypothetical protein